MCIVRMRDRYYILRFIFSCRGLHFLAEMEISKIAFYNKLKEVLPEWTVKHTPESLSKIYDDPALQPFLKWFCENVSRENVLTPEEIRIQKYLQSTNQWLQGEELDRALEEATSDCPELMQLVSNNPPDLEKVQKDLEMEKELYEESMEYIQTLKDGIKDLKERQSKLEAEIEEEQLVTKKEEIAVNKLHIDCINLTEELDTLYKQFSDQVEELAEAYANAAEDKGPSILWKQMPINIFIKRMEMYSNYLHAYVKSEFGSTDKDEQISDSDYATFSEGLKEVQVDDMLQEFATSTKELATAKTDEILAKIEDAACASMEQTIIDIYNNGNLKIPQTLAQLQIEITELRSKRDLLEENFELMLTNELEPLIEQYVQAEVTEVLISYARAILERRKDKCQKLDEILTLARDQGHAYSDLLCILMYKQLQHEQEVVHFISNARYFLETEYTLSEMRCKSMKKQQEEYQRIINGPPKDSHWSNKIFLQMMQDKENHESDENIVKASLKRFNDLVKENTAIIDNIMGPEIDARMDRLQPLEEKVMALYDTEINDGKTVSFKPMSSEIKRELETVTNTVQEMKDKVTSIRNELKHTIRNCVTPGLEREKKILWQRFLADPEGLQRNYDEAVAKLDQSNFVSSL